MQRQDSVPNDGEGGIWVDSQIVADIAAVRHEWRRQSYARGEEGPERFPDRSEIAAMLAALFAGLFPHRLGGFTEPLEAEDAFVRARLATALERLRTQIEIEHRYWQTEARAAFEPDDAADIVRHFASYLSDIRRLVDSDIEAAFQGDPAARCVDEILIAYPGASAILHHRVAHRLHELGACLVARIISEIANSATGIDIHPGARIGPSFFIDHGTGVVIGETAVVGARVRLYQHVTLGARKLLTEGDDSPTRRLARHPIVEDDVVIYAGATILGRVRIGRRAIIGGNVWLSRDVPPDSIVEQPPASIRASVRAGLFTEA